MAGKLGLSLGDEDHPKIASRAAAFRPSGPLQRSLLSEMPFIPMSNNIKNYVPFIGQLKL
jgi:hypothetical protein